MPEHTTAPAEWIDLADNIRVPAEIMTSTLAALANRGGGKSSVAHLYVEKMFDAHLPVVVVDVKGDWWGIRSSADGQGEGLPFIIFGGDHGDVPLEPTTGELLADLIVDDRIPAVLDLSHMSKTQARTFATAFAERLYRRNREPLSVVIEEADVLIPQRASADTARLLGAMEDIAKRGRHRGLGLVVLSQRPQEVAKSVLDLMETVVLLRITGPRSIKAVQDWINVNADQSDNTTASVISSLPSLQVGEGWVWSPGFLRILERAAFPKFRTFDSHATPKPGQVRVVPKVRADIDLDQLGADIAATRDRARDNDPRALHAEITTLRTQLDTARQQAATAATQLADRDREITELHATIDDLTKRARVDVESLAATLRSAGELIDTARQVLDDPPATPPSPAAAPPPPPVAPPRRTPRPARARAATTPTMTFRAGEQRMIEALARMSPLRLTKAQWSTLAKVKHTGGTWTTYLSHLSQAGFIDKNDVGYTLTETGWDYVGDRPTPVTADELQQHYLSILRAGEARMLRAIMAAHPNGLTRDEISAQAEIASSGGTFTTYLSRLRTNGLVEARGDRIVASKILMYGSEMAPNDTSHRQ